MEEINTVLKAAILAWREQSVSGRSVKEGDSFVAIFNDGYMYVKAENETLSVDLIPGRPAIVDGEMGVY